MHDEYGLIGPPTHLYRHHRLDAAGIAAAAAEFLGVRSAENASADQYGT
jgi:transketolase